jgi:hypothetical protein
VKKIMSAGNQFFVTAAAVFVGVLFAGIAIRAIDKWIFKKESFEIQKENYENIDEEDRDS